MDKLEFCAKFIWLRNQPINFNGRPYLRAPYASQANKLVIRASRQVEKSTFLVNSILCLAIQHPGIHILVVFPRQEQAHVFSKSRLLATIEDSPLIARHLLGRSRRKPSVMQLRFNNKSEVYIRAAYLSGDPVRGIDADVLLVDEFQDIAHGFLPVLEETMSHSQHRKLILTGTPKTIDNHLEDVFRQSTANEFMIPCRECRRDVLLDERCLGETGPMCPDCLKPIDVRQGRWIPRNPTSSWGDGFWINHLMVPWSNYAELLDKQRTYDPALFKNECLGMPTTLGELVVTRAELEACCAQTPMASTLNDVPSRFRNCLVAGVDWGGGGISRTALVIGFMDDRYQFVVVRFDRFAAREEPDQILREVGERCRQFGIRFLAADGNGNGNVYNRLLLDRLNGLSGFYAIFYSNSGQEPRQDGALWHWTVGRSATIGTVFARVKKRMLLFPRVQDCGSYLDELGCEVAEYNDSARSIKYSHPDSQPDDALHALNYALMSGTRLFNSAWVG
jgi:hypothetical protein